MLDLAFTEEQEMLRARSRAPAARARAADVGPRDGGRPGRATPPDLWKQLGAARPARACCCPRSTAARAWACSKAWCSTRSWAVALAPTPHFVSCVASGTCSAAGGTDAQQAEWLPRIASGEAVAHAGVARAGRRLRAPGRAGARRRRRTARASRCPASSATSPSRRRPPGSWCWPAPATATGTSTCSSSTRTRPASPSPSSSPSRRTPSTGSTSTACAWPPPTASAPPGRGGRPGRRCATTR